jgi:type II secretory pathway pseudopilin PulG
MSDQEDREAAEDVSRDFGLPQAEDESVEPWIDDYASPSLEGEKKKQACITPLFVVSLAAVTLLLAAILVPNFVRARARGQLTACKSNLKNIGTALEMYSTDWSGKYPVSTSLLTPNYLKTVPDCPSAASNSYRAYFGVKAPYNVGPEGPYEDYYYIECAAENHANVSVTSNFPAYNGIQGLIERRPD